MTHLQQAAQELAERRIQSATGERLPPELRPQNIAQALDVQQAVAAELHQRGDSIGGWKCLLPPPDKTVIGPIYQSRIFLEGDCSCAPLKSEAAIEPEFAFKFAQSLPVEGAPYSREQVAAAIGSTHLALELIKSRYTNPDECEFPELLADGLFNQGLVLGPAISGEPPASCPLTVTVNGESKSFAGVHPNEDTFAPVVWMVNFLAERGIAVEAGQAVITGSFAGVIPVPFGAEVVVGYEGYGEIKVKFSEL